MKIADIIIVGGGVIGSSIAYNLLNDGYTGKIVVFEKDSLYEFSSTPRSAGGIRQLFTTGINVQISRYGLQKYKNFAEDISINGEKAEIDLKQRGYLFLAQDKNRYELEQQAKLQQAYDVPSEFLSPDDLLNVIPELHTDDLVGGLYCAEDGYLDPYSVMTGYAKKAKQLGTEYIYEPVDHLLTDKKEITGVELENGEVYS